MRTRLVLPFVVLLLVAAPAAAEPDYPIAIDITGLTITGGSGIDAAVVRHVFDEAIDAAQRCYDNVKSKPAKLDATVTLKLQIDYQGAIAHASAVGLPSVNRCIAASLNTLAFDALGAGAMDVTAKLAFRTPVTVGPGSGGAFTMVGTAVPSTGFDDGLSQPSMPRVSLGRPSVQGDLGKAVIRRYVERRYQKLKSCYETQLLSKPGLAGAVEAHFTIGADGKVTSSTATGVDPDVASCVADVIRRIWFPDPKTTGAVQVSYPFALRQGST